MRRSILRRARVVPAAMVVSVVLALVVGPALPAGASVTWVTTEVGTTLGVGGYAGLDQISCVSTTFCVGAGTYRDVASTYQIFASMWNGATWSDQELAATLNLGGAGDVNGVSCGSPTLCVVTGYYKDASSVYHPYAALWNGTSWSAQEIAGSLNANGSGDAYHASCVGTSFCAVVGEFDNPTTGEHAYVTTWNGVTWSAHALTTTTGTSYANSLSCASATYCLAGGQYTDASSQQHAYVSVWNGVGWNDQEVAASLNVGGSAAVQSLECLSATFCDAGGYYSDGSNHQQAFIGLWNGAAWSYSEVGAALNVGHDAKVSSVSCLSSSMCVGAGTYTDSHSKQQGFATVLQGSGWNDQPLVTSLNAGGAVDIYGATCLNADECMVVGQYSDAATHYQAFQSVWNGQGWTDQEELGALNAGGDASILSLSCLSPGFCAEAQYYTDASNHGHTLAALTMTDQSPLIVTPSSTTGFAGHTWTMAVSGGTGSGSVSLTVAGLGCSLVGTTLSANQATTCSVTATKAASGIFNAATSAPATVDVLHIHQSRLSITNRQRHVLVGARVVVKVKGGSGPGVVSFHVRGRGCTMKGDRLRDRLATRCVVVARKASSPVYYAKNSLGVTFVFSAKK